MCLRVCVLLYFHICEDQYLDLKSEDTGKLVYYGQSSLIQRDV